MKNNQQDNLKPGLVVVCLLILGLTVFGLLVYSHPEFFKDYNSSLSQIQDWFPTRLGLSIS
jgi:hypothetical protein